MTGFPANEYAAQLITQPTMHKSPKLVPSVIIEIGLPCPMMVLTPVSARKNPVIFQILNFSLKTTADPRAMNVGVAAMISAALPAVTVCSPLKNRILYRKTPVRPRKASGRMFSFVQLGFLPVALHERKNMKIVAKKKRRKAAEYGVRFPARIRPAIHVPPQKITEPISLK